jgi:alpha-amylase
MVLTAVDGFTRKAGKNRRLRRTAVAAAAGLLVAFGLTATSADGAPGSSATDEPGVTANLWEWNWPSIGRECADVLGPSGYTGVQVAPPQDSVKRTELGNGSDTVLHPWWEVYQVVDYNLTSRMGDEAQFKAMVKACRKAGVKVYVDAVINHTTGQGHISYGGVSYTPYHYADAGYGPDDFHFTTGECPSSDGGIQDFNNKLQVFKCNLVGLEDLRTETDAVQDTLAAYLNKLIGYGASGFRVDAAKHIGQDDLDAIYSRLHRTKDGVKPYWALEVFGGGPGILSPQAFTSSGDVLGLDGVKQIRDAFKSYPAQHVGSIATLEVFGAGSGLTPGAKTLSFVDNHDTERNGDALNYKDGARFILANEWLLAQGYGSPQIFSSFEWGADSNASPPALDNGLITDTDCAAGWACTHRNQGILGMVGWNNYVGSAQRGHFYTDDANVIAFSKGDRGWAAFNNGAADKQITVQTGLAAGTYCDLIHGTRQGSSCTGPTVTVTSNGNVTVTVGAYDAVAIDRANRL